MTMINGFGGGFSTGNLGTNAGFNFGFYRPTVQYIAGIKADRYTQGYFADSMTWFDNLTPTTTTYPTDKIEDPGTDDGSTFSRRWTGYFRAPTTETYTFYLSSDDASYLWLGDTAKSGWSAANALVDNGGLHGVVEESGTVGLTAGVFYPIQVFFGENGGGDELTFSYSTPTITKTSNLTDLIYYNGLSRDNRGF